MKTKKCGYCKQEISIMNYTRHIKKHIKINKYSDDIIKDYNNKYTYNEIRRKYKLQKSDIDYILDINNIEKRTQQESIKNGREKSNYKMSDETKQKISKKLSKAHSEGRHPGWSHINLDKSRRSYPEKIIYNLKNNDFFQLLMEEKYPFGKYFLDFAFINKKIDLEIDGEQHYKEEAIIYDNIRNQYLNDNGWIVYRISWYDLRNNRESELNKLKKFLISDNIKNRFYVKIEKEKSYCKCGVIIDKKSKQCSKCQHFEQRKVKERPSYEQLLKDIKETNYSVTGKKYGVSDNAIRKWIKKYKLNINASSSLAEDTN